MTRDWQRIISTFAGRSPRGDTREVRVRYDRSYDEYICEVRDGGRRNGAADYFTSSRSDALATAAEMCGHNPR